MRKVLREGNEEYHVHRASRADDERPALAFKDLPSAVSFLQRFKSDVSEMSAMRGLLPSHHFDHGLSRLDDDEVIIAFANGLVRGEYIIGPLWPAQYAAPTVAPAPPPPPKPKPKPQPQPARKTAKLKVKVVRADHKAIARPATVEIQGPSPGSKPTNASGVAEFAGLAVGDYTVTVKLSDQDQALKLQDGSFEPGTGHGIALGPNDDGLLIANLLPPGSLEVIVLGSLDDAFLGNVKVAADGPMKKDANSQASNGCALLNDLKEGTYKLALTVPDNLADIYGEPAQKPEATITHGQHAKLVVKLPGRPSPTIKIDDPKVVLVKRSYQDRPELNVRPHRIPVKLGVVGAFDGTGELRSAAANTIRVFASQDATNELALPLALTAQQLTGGHEVFIEGKNPSASVGGTELVVEISGSTLLPKTPTASEKITCVQLRLDVHRTRPDAGGDPPQMGDDVKINPGRHLVVQGASDDRLFSERALVVLKKAEPSAFTGKLVIKKLSEGIKIFGDADEIPAAGQAPVADASLVFANDTIDQAAGKRFWVEGKTTSGAMGDTGLFVGLESIANSEGDRVVMTVLKLELRLHKSRTDVAAAGDPVALTDDEKFKDGRFVHVQDAGFRHGRALLIIRKVEPAGFTGTLTLNAYNAVHAPNYSGAKAANPRVQVFNQEVAATGQAAVAFGDIDHPAAFPADGRKLWVQGKTASAALRDAELRLGVKDCDKGAERVEMTVVKFKNLKAVVHNTPPNQIRGGNWPVAAQTNSVTVVSDCSENFNRADTLVLIEDSVPAASPIELTVDVEPAGVNVPVSWSARRDWRPAPNGDHDDIVALYGNPDNAPTVTPDGGNAQKATLTADAVGSYWIRAFVDCNGSGEYDDYVPRDANAGQRIDREPFLLLPLLLIRVQGIENTSRARQANVRLNPAAPTSATGVGVSTGNFAGGATAGCHCRGKVKLIGGGRDGVRGINRVFAGWINNETQETAVSEYRDIPAGINRIRQSVFSPTPAHGVFQVITAPGAAYTPQALPVLDCTNFGNEGTGGNRAVGTEGAPGPPAINRNVAQPAGELGRTFMVQMWDSPGDNCPPAHESYAGRRLVRYRFNLDFRCDLVFWTNSSGTQSPTVHPACRLYSRVYTNSWHITLEINFNAAGNAVMTTPLGIRLTKDNADDAFAEPVEGTGLEVRFPIGLRLLLVDARP